MGRLGLGEPRCLHISHRIGEELLIEQEVYPYGKQLGIEPFTFDVVSR